MSNQLLTCPFCNAAMSIESNRDWHRIVGEHDERCLFMDRETVTVPATDEQLELAMRDWNRRAAQPAAGEPVAWVMWSDGRIAGVTHHRNVAESWMGEHDVQALGVLGPAAAHGDEAVRLLDRVITQVGRTITSDLREEIDALLDPQRKAVMRAQGDGSNGDA